MSGEYTGGSQMRQPPLSGVDGVLTMRGLTYWTEYSTVCVAAEYG